MTASRAAGLAVLAVLLVAGGAPPCRADVLHLRGGGEIRTRSWWIDGDTLRYESSAGTVGIPRSEVLRIEPRDDGEATVAVPPRASAPAPVASSGPSSKADDLEQIVAAGRTALTAHDFASAAARFREAMTLRPEAAGPRIGYAVSEIARDNDGLALSAVLEGLVHAPGNADLHELLGDLMNRDERVEDAVRAWREAFDLVPSDRLREKILKGERELAAGRHYTFSATAHFNVRHDDALDPSLASAIVDFLESSYWELTGALRHAPQQPITVLLYPLRQFRDVTQTPEWVAGLYDGKIRVPLGGIHRLDPRARRLLLHELTHAVVHSKTHGNCPRWLQEGLAQRFEGRALDPRQRAEVAALLAQVDPPAWESRGFSYPAALSLVDDLAARRGEDGLVRLLDRLGDGHDVDAALGDVYGLDYDALTRAWARAVAGTRR